MKIGSISEELTSEKRISLTPELSKKYLDMDLEIIINKNYGIHLGFHDKISNPSTPQRPQIQFFTNISTNLKNTF